MSSRDSDQKTKGGFQTVLDHIRSIADSEAQKGRLFERLMKTYFIEDPLYRERFSHVWLWGEWASQRIDFDGADIGIDLVAEEREGGYCAIQCKCYAPDTRIAKKHLDSFISASAREPFTHRIFVDTGDSWGPNAYRTIKGLKPECQVLRFGDLANRQLNWPDLVKGKPEDLSYRQEIYRLRPHQQTAFDDVTEGFDEHDRGKLIMACGTGKTFTSLRIAEAVAGLGGRVLYLVPSISLLQQSIREWAEQREIAHMYIGICSDKRAGYTDEDASIQELEIPVTTDPKAIAKALQLTKSDAMTVVFCTYHSLPIIENAQDDGAPPFDFVLCDEAHKTTGIERPGDKTSPFVLVHDGERIRALKRLYMTATPRLYTRSAKAKAASHDVEVFSMDDEDSYGPELHRLPFSRAVEKDLLSDYKVVVFALSEEQVDGTLQAHLATGSGEINISDAAKIVGCWQALQNPEHDTAGNGSGFRLKRAIAFTNTILSSQRLEKHWDGIVDQAIDKLPERERMDPFRCEIRHVDGKHHALERKARLDWLKSDSGDNCRILSNARCLSEGIDVPALDAVLFMSSKNSQVDIVQAVGRTMRKSPGKEYGYIVLPVTVPAGTDPVSALNDNERFSVVWSVVRALRSHDDRFDAEINKIDLNKTPTSRIIFSGDGVNGGQNPEALDLPFPPLDLPPGAIFAKIVERCGDRKYWETWAKDVADIFTRLVERIKALLKSPENDALREWFDAFHGELRESIHDSITCDNGIEMMAQHILTRPVFEALFEHYDFAESNPVAQALDALRADFGEFGLENETRDLEPFYESVRMRARGLDNSQARQRVLMELYEKFFATALKKEADRLGIVYTPVEVVDFILHSADHALKLEFGLSLSDEDVHVLDPFTGTGIFLVRLIQSALIRNTDVIRKYRKELHANEIVLLAYYIAAIHIEEAFHGRRSAESGYEPFEGIVLTDTFNLHTDRTGFPSVWLPDNSERVERQQNTPIQVIVGNPPWSGKQKSSADDNPNVDYPELEQRVSDTYAARSTATNKNSLYNTYKMAIRWASDRIGDQGIVAFVTDGSWIDGNVDSSIRACLAEEFNSIYVMNLRGHTWKGSIDGGNVFKKGCSARVAIMVLVRNPNSTHSSCSIHYHDIGDYLKREEKLRILRQSGSIAGIYDWKTITPNKHHDWIRQRGEVFQGHYPMGSKIAKAGKADDAIFKLFSNGYKTSRDPYIYNFSVDACAEIARAMVGDYLGAMQVREEHPEYSVDEVASRHSSNVKWNQELKDNLARRKSVAYSFDNISTTQYRPFVKQYCYIDHVFAQRKYQMDRIFPESDTENLAICVSGKGSKKAFSVLIVDSMPDLNLLAAGCQCFPRYRYRKPHKAQYLLPGYEQELEQIDNISDTALRAFRARYNDHTISRDDIFDYLYGILHAPDYRQRFANDLSKELPRIPFAPDFQAFAEAGQNLAELHLGYETCDEYPLNTKFSGKGEPQARHFRIGTKYMKFADAEKSNLIVNEYIRLENIPAEAHSYVVNGRTPLEWFIDRYRIKKDTRSGIVNDPNGWFDAPRDLITAFRRIVHVSVESTRIVSNLPSSIDENEGSRHET